MKVIILTLCFFIAFINYANADKMYNCIDKHGNRIITDNPQDGMMDCSSKSSEEDQTPKKNSNVEVTSQCNLVSSNMNNARVYLNRAASRNFSELDKGKEDVRKAIDFLSEAEMNAGHCQCPAFSNEISNAAQYARTAITENSASQFSDSLTKAISTFNNSIEVFKTCK